MTEQTAPPQYPEQCTDIYSQLIGFNKYAEHPCTLRAGHPGDCEPLRQFSTYSTVALVEPSDRNSTCNGCRRSLPRGVWTVRLPEVAYREDSRGASFCRDCAGDIARAAASLPTGPAPDPLEE